MEQGFHSGDSKIPLVAIECWTVWITECDLSRIFFMKDPAPPLIDDISPAPPA